MNKKIIEQKQNKKPGRKPKYNKTLLREVFEDLAKGLSITKALQKPNRPAWSTFREYLNNYPDLKEEYLKAKSEGIEFVLNEAENLLDETITETQQKGKGDLALTHLVKSSVDFAKWKAEKLSPNYSKSNQIAVKNGDSAILVKWQD